MNRVLLSITNDFSFKKTYSNPTQTYWLGGSHLSQTINHNVYEKVNPETQKHVKVIKDSCYIVGPSKS